MKYYQRGRNWSAKCGVYRNGYHHRIREPRSYFKAVGLNRYGYNHGYRNGYGQRIRKPYKYFKVVGEDRYGYNSRWCRW